MPPKAATPPKLSPQDVLVVFQRYRTELQNLAQKIGELESEMEEHACVQSLSLSSTQALDLATYCQLAMATHTTGSSSEHSSRSSRRSPSARATASSAASSCSARSRT